MPASDTSPPVPTAAPATSPPSSSDSFSQLEHSAPDLIISSSDLATSSTTSKTIVNGAEPEKHPKGKRKRTAAKDKSILENAYLANPKPDKAARLDIVKRVSLNEKEVQVKTMLYTDFNQMVTDPSLRSGFKTVARMTGASRVPSLHRKSQLSVTVECRYSPLTLHHIALPSARIRRHQ
ncbi:MBF complex negative regulatory component yox1 [Colletotrichum sp. SAR 10_86]|nr:MBF complex negative regulatory component yox1 [Colletotrichum sp. SAR 10_86]